MSEIIFVGSYFDLEWFIDDVDQFVTENRDRNHWFDISENIDKFKLRKWVQQNCCETVIIFMNKEIYFEEKLEALAFKLGFGK